MDTNVEERYSLNREYYSLNADKVGVDFDLEATALTPEMVSFQKNLGDILVKYKDKAYLEITTAEGIYRNYINSDLINEIFKFLNGDWHKSLQAAPAAPAFRNNVFQRNVLVEQAGGSDPEVIM